MPFKKMTVPEQRRAKRELKQLRALVSDLRSQYSGTQIAVGDICAAAHGAIRAAIALGYIVVVRLERSSSRPVAYAYRLGEPR